MALKSQNDVSLNFFSTLAVVMSYHLHLQMYDGSLHSTSLSTLNANVLRTISDIQKHSMALFPILSDLKFEINMFFS